MSELAYFGGTPAINKNEVPKDLFAWPIMTEEDEAAALAEYWKEAFV